MGARRGPLGAVTAGRPLRVGVVGCGTGGPAAALLLARRGHAVEVLDRAPVLGPVGAGLLLQPTGQAVLRGLGLLDEVARRGAPVRRLLSTAHTGRPVLDLAYADLDPAASGLGATRGSLFGALHRALVAQGIPVRTGVEVAGADDGPRGTTLRDTAGGTHGPYDLVVGADGARSAIRRAVRVRRRVHDYPWGALWALLPDPDGRYAGVLRQHLRGPRRMLGFLPSGAATDGGPPLVSLFWSIRLADVDAWRRAGLAAWKREVLALTAEARPLLDAIEDPAQVLLAAYRDVRCRPLHDGRVVLLGDAAHAMSPQLGQGANLALLDAWTLAACVGDGVDLAGALARFSALRRRHLRFYGVASRALTPLFQSALDAVGPPRDLLGPPAGRLPWLRGQMLRSLAGTKTGLVGEIGADDLAAPLPGPPRP